MLNGMKMPTFYHVHKPAFSTWGQELSIETSEEEHAFFVCLVWGREGGREVGASSPFLFLRTPLLNVECIRQISSKTFPYRPSKKKS